MVVRHLVSYGRKAGAGLTGVICVNLAGVNNKPASAPASYFVKGYAHNGFYDLLYIRLLFLKHQFPRINGYILFNDGQRVALPIGK